MKTVSVIIPCRNEEKYIAGVLENLLIQDYNRDFIKILVVDGLSTDSTIAIVKEYSKKYSFIKLIENPNKTVPFALNIGIKISTSDLIIRMDAHAIYPKDYISQLVEGLSTYNCDNIGGVWLTEPANNSIKARAIAMATSHPFGIGNAYYRLPVSKPRQVDTVPFGCYKRELFDEIGFFDEDLIRNQDDEFNARLIKSGRKIFLIPAIKIRYFARECLSKTSKMFFQYGLFKPLVNIKVGKPTTIRQFAPLILVALSVLCAVFIFISEIIFVLLVLPIFCYLLLDIGISISISIKQKSAFRHFMNLFILFPLIHYSYGIGYFSGIVRFIIFRSKKKISLEENR